MTSYSSGSVYTEKQGLLPSDIPLTDPSKLSAGDRSDTEASLSEYTVQNLPSGHRSLLQLDNEFDDSSEDDFQKKKQKSQDISNITNGEILKIHIDDVSDDGGKTNKDVIIQAKRERFVKNGKLRSRFADVKFIDTTSILDSKTSQNSDFRGFYTLFWLGTALFAISTFVNHHQIHGTLIDKDLLNILSRDVIAVLSTDIWMYVCTYFGFFLQLACKKNLIDFNKSGWIIQNLYQTSFFFFFLWWAYYKNFPWIGRVFLVLHSLVLIMKQHSYAFYNGYLWRIYNERRFNKQKLLKFGPQLDYDETRLLKDSIKFCDFELKSQSVITPFPSNLTFSNYFMYSMFPVLVYEIDYPRTEKIRIGYALEKFCAIFGVIFLMIMLAQNYMFPVAMKSLALRDTPFLEKARIFPVILVEMAPPFLLMYLLVFYLIWDAILNEVAELTRFADRDFYGDWWNCVTWDEFARIWNKPVHKFLLRHVYHSSISSLSVSKHTATLLTFLLSSLVHELVMFVIFQKLRGYLLVLQMLQLPLVMISRMKLFKDQKLFGNIIFWIGISSSPSLVCLLYLTF